MHMWTCKQTAVRTIHAVELWTFGMGVWTCGNRTRGHVDLRKCGYVDLRRCGCVGL